MVEEQEWHVLVREPDGGEGRYVYWHAAGALAPKRDDIIEIDPLTKILVLSVEPRELRAGEVGIIRGRRQSEAG